MKLLLWRMSSTGQKLVNNMRGDGVVHQTWPGDVYTHGCAYGVMGKAADAWRETRKKGFHWLYADGPYFLRRKPDSIRLAWDQQWFSRKGWPVRRTDDLEAKGCILRPWRKERGPIVYVCPSNQMQHANGYGDTAEGWTKKTIAELRRYTDRPIEVRAKPGAGDGIAPRVASMEKCFDNAWAIVTAGSTIGCEALAYGVPVFTDKPCASSALAKMHLGDIESPYEPTDDEREEWARDLCARQFDVTELNQGKAWAVMREDLEQVWNCA